MASLLADPRFMALRAMGVPCCKVCGAPQGERVVRLRAKPVLWSLNTELHMRHADVYRRPARVVIHQSGVCIFCETPRGYHLDSHPGDANASHRA